MKTISHIRAGSPTWRDLPIDLISRSPIALWAPVPLRLIVGYGFMEHGFAKLARGLASFPAILQALGVPAPHLMGWLTILVEIFGGLAVLLGALVPLASIPMAAVLLVAIFTVHLPYGFSSIKLQAVTAAGAQFGPPGFETDLLYLACLVALVLGGSGPLAIDGLLAKRREIARPWMAALSQSGEKAAARLADFVGKRAAKVASPSEPLTAVSQGGASRIAPLADSDEAAGL
jgi:putative oxidoreductase